MSGEAVLTLVDILVRTIVEVLQALVPLFAVLLGVYLTYYLGRKAYKERKAVEECRQKYLTEGVDLLKSDLEHMVGAFNRNWVTVLFQLERLGTLPDDQAILARSSLLMEVESFEPPTMGLGPLCRAEELLGMERPPEKSALRKWHFSALADHSGAREGMVRDVAQVAKDPSLVAGSKDRFVKAFKEELEKRRRECQRHELLLGQLTELSSILWQGGISYDNLSSIPCWPRVVEISQAISKGYGEIEAQNQERHRALAKLMA